ncbi:MFS transporter [Paenibacillus sp. GCM10023248]|uniref:MFS transporter n=1 Tax=Bacillales TaxID=1385 RepID=UPI0023780AD8|nr:MULTISPECIES: MFS transporter [Bacillales]MDD9269996.1 MFS transporter [Paenibacillus sp. MAHUQ-63]MDR6880129.1 MFS family permease [Bacillus sp. 3255]
MESLSLNERKKRKPLWTKAFLITSLSNLLLFFSFQMLIPTIPTHVAQLGGNDMQVGLVIGIFTISSLITRPFAGRALDLLGRKHVLLVGLAICTLTIAGYSYMAVVALILAARFVHGIGWGMSTTSLGTVIADIIPPERRGEGMGYYGLSNTFAMALAPLTGLWLMQTFSFHRVLLISTLLALLSLFSSLFISYEKPVSPRKQAQRPKLIDRLWERSAILPSVMLLFTAICYGGIVTFITLYGHEAGISNVGWFFLCNAAMVLIVRPITGVLFDRKGPVWVLLLGALFTISGLLLLSYAHSELSLAIAALCYGVGFGSLQPALQAWTIARAAPDRRGAASGTFFSANDLGIGLGAMVLGAFANITGSYALMYRCSTVLIVIFLIIYGWSFWQAQRSMPLPQR